MQRTQSSPKFTVGSNLPQFKLRNVDDSLIDSSEIQVEKALLVVFTCNHCPYVKGSEQMLIELVNKYKPEGLAAITINSNDATKYPDDSFENMQRKSKEMNLPYPYLYDETQEVAKAFDAACTPECFLFNSEKKLVYQGAISDNPRDAAGVSKVFLAEAIEKVLAGEQPEHGFVHTVGCSIKWRG